MENKAWNLFVELFRQPAGKRAASIVFLLPFAIILFYETRDSYAKDRVKELEAALNISEIKRERERNQYISTVKECDKEKAKIVSVLNGKLDEFKELVREREEQRTLEIEAELRELRRGVKQTGIILQRTERIQKN